MLAQIRPGYVSILGQGPVLIELRPSVRDFAEAMELKLRDNDYKSGWYLMSPAALHDRLEEEVRELLKTRNPEDGCQEAVDVANFAMMIFDNFKDNPHGDDGGRWNPPNA